MPTQSLINLPLTSVTMSGPPTSSKPQLCFLCTGNSCRSVMAEGWAKHIHGDRYTVYSAGSVPAAVVNPGAVEAMREVGIDMSSHIPKTLTSLQSQGFHPDYVVTVCNDACPSVPRGAKSVHIGFDDPAGLPLTMPHEERMAEFRRVRDEIKSMVEQLPGKFDE